MLCGNVDDTIFLINYVPPLPLELLDLECGEKFLVECDVEQAVFQLEHDIDGSITLLGKLDFGI